MTTTYEPRIDSAAFRHALGHVPTSVCVITVEDEQGRTGMTVGSFTSISLDPPLVGFFADSNSSTLARVVEAGRFTVNLLNDAQGYLCKAFARRGVDKFDGVPVLEGDGFPAPRLADALGWIDCTIDSVAVMGDHDAVVGRVDALEVNTRAGKPLVFFRGSLCQLDKRTVPHNGVWELAHYEPEL